MSPSLSRLAAIACALVGFSVVAPAVEAHASFTGFQNPHSDVWVGGGRTDKWTDAGNWANGRWPHNGDTVVIPQSDVVAEQNIPYLNLYELDLPANHYWSITGQPIVLGAAGMHWTGSGDGLVWKTPLVLTGATPVYLGAGNTVYLNGAISGTGSLSVTSGQSLSSLWMDVDNGFAPSSGAAITADDSQLVIQAAGALGHAGNLIHLTDGASLYNGLQFTDSYNFTLDDATVYAIRGWVDRYTGTITVNSPSTVDMAGAPAASSVAITGTLHLNANLAVTGATDNNGYFSVACATVDGTGSISFNVPGAIYYGPDCVS